jgi:predicted ATPase
MSIKRLEIAGFKSIDSIELTDLPNYCVFAGANGAGKSNFFDALKFASTVIDDGAIKAIRQFHGYDRIHCVKRRKDKARTFRFVCDAVFPKTNVDYSLDLFQMDKDPELQERLAIDISDGTNNCFIRDRMGFARSVDMEMGLSNYPKDYSMMARWFFLPNKYVPNWFKDFRIFRFDPFRAKEPDEVGADTHYLDEYGRNLSTVLEAMQKTKGDYETIMEWMSMIVPGLDKIRPQRNPLNGSATMMFQESGTKYHFPPGLISDGTIYVLCLLTAVLTRIKKPGVTMIEEPERGIHPKAIEQLSQFFRERASDEHQIFISTHNESFVRSAKAEELFFVVKEDGRTQFRLGRDVAESVKGMPNDKAWLQNMFDGGLPW